MWWYGESNEDIIDMAFALRAIDADNSIPINFYILLKELNLVD